MGARKTLWLGAASLLGFFLALATTAYALVMNDLLTLALGFFALGASVLGLRLGLVGIGSLLMTRDGDDG